MENFFDKAVEIITTAGSKLILALLIWIIGSMVVKKVIKMIMNMKSAEKLEPTVKSFLGNFLKVVLYVVLVLSIIGVLGVPMASVVAVLAACGLAVGMSLQGSLANLAGGIMLMIFRPFKVGDYISGAGDEGIVQELGLFYTELLTLDNKRVMIPNGALMNANIQNFSAEERRRVDLTFNLTGGRDINEVKSIIENTMLANSKVLKDPAPFANPLEGVPGGLAYTARAWVNSADYWDVYFDLMREIPTALGEAAVAGPAPTTNVNLNK